MKNIFETEYETILKLSDDSRKNLISALKLKPDVVLAGMINFIQEYYYLALHLKTNVFKI